MMERVSLLEALLLSVWSAPLRVNGRPGPAPRAGVSPRRSGRRSRRHRLLVRQHLQEVVEPERQGGDGYEGDREKEHAPHLHEYEYDDEADEDQCERCHDG